jgi:hypothetical protein
MLPTDVSTNGRPISYSIRYARNQPLDTPVPDQTVKLMLAGRARLNGHIFYVPLLPCVTNFAQVPALTLPQSSTPIYLEPALGVLSASGCNNTVYTFNPEPPPRRTFVPTIRQWLALNSTPDLMAPLR